MVGIGHLGADGEGTRLGIDLRIGEIDQSPVGVFGAVGQRHGDIGVPFTGRIAVSEIDVAGFAAQVVQRRHAEIDAHRIALHHRRQQRFAVRPHERSDIGVALGDIPRDGRLDIGIAQRHFGLREVGLAHHHVGRGALVRSDGVVQFELAGRALLVERTDTVEVALGLEGLRARLVELRLGLIDTRPVHERVDHEKRLPFLDIGAFGEKHLFEVALDTGTDFDELLGADAAHVIAVNIDVLCGHGFHGHDRKRDRRRPRPEQQSKQQARDDRGAGYRNPLPAAQLHADTGRTRSCLLHAGQIQVLQIGFQLVKFHRVYIK